MNATRTHSNAVVPPVLSVILPVHNEAACIGSIIDEILAVLQAPGGQPFEVIAVDDGSTDGTPALLASLAATDPRVRVFSILPHSGQSAALGVGFAKCRGRVAVLMDADGQNDPHDIPILLDALRDSDACCGYRTSRCDTVSKRLGSRLANRVRQFVLHDGIRDAGCSLKAVKVEFLRDLPMQLRGMHRFLPVLWLMRGARITQMPVNHRPRIAGTSKYTNWGRLKEAIWDLWAVRWMQKRYRRYQVMEGGIRV